MTATLPGRAEPLDLAGPLPRGLVVVEASAGTGKTYALAALAARAIVERQLPPSALAMVTFTRAAAAELRERTRSKLVEAAAALAPGAPVARREPWLATVVDATNDERAARREHLRQSIARFDEATITTIHGFCQHALAQVGLRAPLDPDARIVADHRPLAAQVCRDVLVRLLACDPGALGDPGRDAPVAISTLEAMLTASVSTVLTNPGSVVVPSRDGLGAGLGAAVAARWRCAVDEALAELRRRRRMRREIGFDDLVTVLHEVLHGPGGDEVVASLRARYEMVLVDEFQDTDPVQWDILSTAFRSGANPTDVVLVGDPKQAIYRFRGADVHAYLAATAGADARRTLATNHRSDPDLLRALGALLAGATFGDEAIAFAAVDAPEGTPARRLLGPAAGSPLQLRWVEPTDGILDRHGYTDHRAAMRLVLNDLCHHVVALTSGAATIADASGEQRAVHPGDIAVLVRSHDDGRLVAEALRSAGVPHVVTGTTDVLDGEAAHDWTVLLRALAAPGHPGRARAAALGVFVGCEPTELDADGAGTLLAGVQAQLREWADALQRWGVAGFYATVRSSSGLLERVLSRQGGERHITDLDHIAELLHAAQGDAVASPGQLSDALARMAADLDPDIDVDERKRRIDSDARAVQVTTVHASKGLEFPVVLLPMLGKPPASRPTSPLVFHHDGQRTIDVAPGIDWPGATGLDTRARRKAAADHDDVGDDLRLLYVALTRARHQVVLWWTARSKVAGSALGRVLLNRNATGCDTTLARASKDAPKTAPALAEHFAMLDGLAEGAVSCSPVIERGTAPRYVADGGVTAPLTTAAWQRGPLVDRSWRSWSFTAIAGAAADGSGSRHLLAPVVGGEDEGGRDGAADVQRPSGPAASLMDVPSGPTFGVMVHSVLEHVDIATVDEACLATAVTEHSRRAGLDLDPLPIARGLLEAVRTPLGPQFDEICLGDIAGSDRLSELAFEMHLRAGGDRVPAAVIATLLHDHLPPGDPVRSYAAALRDELGDLQLAGYLRGSIDAVLRLRSAGPERYVVVDYKTNRLLDATGDATLAAYHPDRLLAAMADHHYPLQALLYTVALHRFLRWRQPGYDPNVHLGGVAYLFVRAMVGRHTPRDRGRPYGVFAWHPPVALVESLDALLAHGDQQ